MKPFRVHRGRVAPLDRVNVDTDQIIPKQFLKRIERTGFGEFLFYDWRFTRGRKEESRLRSASAVLCGREHSGCGKEFWLRIFAGACCLGAGGLRLPRRDFFLVRRHLRQQLHQEWIPDSASRPTKKSRIDAARAATSTTTNSRLIWKSAKCVTNMDFRAKFTIDDFVRHCLLEGLDDIGLTLQHESRDLSLRSAPSAVRISSQP